MQRGRDGVGREGGGWFLRGLSVCPSVCLLAGGERAELVRLVAGSGLAERSNDSRDKGLSLSLFLSLSLSA